VGYPSLFLLYLWSLGCLQRPSFNGVFTGEAATR